MSESSGAQFVLQRLRARNIGHVDLTYRAAAAPAASVTLVASELEAALEDGLPLQASPPGSAALHRAVLTPDPATFAIVPSPRGEGAALGRLLCDLRREDGTPHPRCSRSVLKRALGAAHTAGDRFYLGARIGHRWFDGVDASGQPRPARPSVGASLGLRLSERMAREGAAPRCWERLDDSGLWSFEYASVDPLALSDALVLHRLAVHAIADAEGLQATFMPRPFTGCVPARLELHLSQDAGEGADWGDPLSPGGLSLRARALAETLARHSAPLALCLRAGVNGWNASDPFTVGALPREHGTALLLGGLDAAADPFLATAIAIALARAEGETAPPSPEVTGPGRVLLAERSSLLAETLGRELLGILVEGARVELRAYADEVSPFEWRQSARAL